MFKEKRFDWRSSSIAYHAFGKGSRLMIAFHGYDQNRSAFDVFEKSLSQRYTVITIDLPHQGNTIWQEDALSPPVLQNLIKGFLTHLGHNHKVSLMAYSLGGNYALGLMVACPDIIEEIWLIAADGVKEKPFFNFLTKTKVGQLLFKRFVDRATVITFLIHASKNLGLTPKHVANFFLESISSKTKRERLYLRWMSSSRIVPKPKDVYSTIRSNNIECILIFGIKDNVIPIKNARTFKKHIPPALLFELEQGHVILTPKNNETITNIIESHFN